MSITRLAVLVVALLFNIGVHASPNTDALVKCLSDNTSGKDRKDLARWVFVAMAAHPEIAVVAKASPKDVEEAQRTTGVLVTRLIADQCPNQMSAVVQTDGSEGARIAFEYLGKLAMQELTSNQEVKAALGGFERYTDQEKINRVVNPRLK